MTSPPSFAGRAFLAVALMLGFYALAGGIILALVGVVYAEAVYLRRVHIQLIFAALIGAYSVLKGVFFLRDRFSPPGPALEPAEHPELFAAIQSVATRMSARMPDVVYLAPDVNAFVAEVGGFMGIFGTRRVMALGVGMLNVDDVSQLKATIAHELGHFQGGDTRLGGFLYRTRAAIGRVMVSLSDAPILAKPFEWYGTLFMRLTQGISRAQELAADAAAVRVAGKRAHISGLYRESVSGALFGRFMRGEVAPLVEERVCPDDIYVGYRAYVANQGADGHTKLIEEALRAAKTDTYDTHPALSERVAFAEALDDGDAPYDERPARLLLRDPERVERSMTSHVLSTVSVDTRTVSWNEVAPVYAARLSRHHGAITEALGGAVDFNALFDAVASNGVVDIAVRLEPDLAGAPNDIRTEAAPVIVKHAYGTALAVALVEHHGGRLETEPGRAIVVRMPDGACIDTFRRVESALEGNPGLSELRRFVDTLASSGRSTHQAS